MSTKRWCVCAKVGTGVPGDQFRAAIQDITDPDTGIQAFEVRTFLSAAAWCFVLAKGSRFDLAAADENVDVMPPMDLPSRVDSMGDPEMVTMFQSLSARGIDVSGFTRASTFRELVNFLGKSHEPGFDAERIDGFL